MDMRTGRLRARLMIKLRVIISTITATIMPISRVSEAAIAAKLTEGPQQHHIHFEQLLSTESERFARTAPVPQRRA